MTLEQKFKELYPQFVCGNEVLSPFFDLFENGYEIGQTEEFERVKTLEEEEKEQNYISAMSEIMELENGGTFNQDEVMRILKTYFS